MNRWYSEMFRIERSDASKTKWWIDYLIFDTFVRDCIAENEADLSMWRIHRRSAGGEAGHQFSFLYYGSYDVSKSIKSFVNQHNILEFLKNFNLLRDWLHREKGNEIEATCDPNWPLPLQKAWPYYIMGVSQMALELIANLRPSPRPSLDKISVEDCEIYYTQIMTKVSEVWQKWGSHAFFHHINAIFGYVPVVAQPRQVSGLMAIF